MSLVGKAPNADKTFCDAMIEAVTRKYSHVRTIALYRCLHLLLITLFPSAKHEGLSITQEQVQMHLKVGAAINERGEAADGDGYVWAGHAPQYVDKLVVFIKMTRVICSVDLEVLLSVVQCLTGCIPCARGRKWGRGGNHIQGDVQNIQNF